MTHSHTHTHTHTLCLCGELWRLKLNLDIHRNKHGFVLLDYVMKTKEVFTGLRYSIQIKITHPEFKKHQNKRLDWLDQNRGSCNTTCGCSKNTTAATMLLLHIDLFSCDDDDGDGDDGNDGDDGDDAWSLPHYNSTLPDPIRPEGQISVVDCWRPLILPHCPLMGGTNKWVKEEKQKGGRRVEENKLLTPRSAFFWLSFPQFPHISWISSSSPFFLISFLLFSLSLFLICFFSSCIFNFPPFPFLFIFFLLPSPPSRISDTHTVISRPWLFLRGVLQECSVLLAVKCAGSVQLRTPPHHSDDGGGGDLSYTDPHQNPHGRANKMVSGSCSVFFLFTLRSFWSF